MKNKGFTLMELLAVIILLAIIALIAVPIVMNIISNAEEASEMRSAELYIDAVDKSVLAYNMSNKLKDAICTVQSDGNLNCDGIIITVDVKNTKATAGTITIENRRVTKVENLTIRNKRYNRGLDGVLVEVTPIDNSCTRETENITYIAHEWNEELGDEEEVERQGSVDTLTCGTEKFYVINEDSTTITAITKYHLDVGLDFSNCNDVLSNDCSITSKNLTGIQKSDAPDIDMESYLLHLYRTVYDNSYNYEDSMAVLDYCIANGESSSSPLSYDECKTYFSNNLNKDLDSLGARVLYYWNAVGYDSLGAGVYLYTDKYINFVNENNINDLVVTFLNDYKSYLNNSLGMNVSTISFPDYNKIVALDNKALSGFIADDPFFDVNASIGFESDTEIVSGGYSVKIAHGSNAGIRPVVKILK